MELSYVNNVLNNFQAAYLENYVSAENSLVLQLEAGGGVWENFQARLVFREVQVFHLSRALHFTMGLRIASASEAMALNPTYDDQDTTVKYFIITEELPALKSPSREKKIQDTAFYIAADSVELQGIPDKFIKAASDPDSPY